ncbi:MAG: VWA domain-containing protein, partial [Bacteroidota bacterium]
LKKYVDQQLLTFRYEDRKLVTSRDNIMEVHQRVRKKEKGPFIVLVDTSQSMQGRPEEIAKVLCLGILKMAIKDNRRAYLINFSQGINTIDLFDIYNSLEEVANFLRMSFNGGTDASLALSEAVRQLRTNDYEDADVLMISDFIMYRLDKEVLDEIRYFQQNKGTEFHSLAISQEANGEFLRRFDTNWVYDPRDKGIIRELTRGLKTIGER